MNKHLIVLGIAVLLICVGLCGCNEQKETVSNDIPTSHMIQYKVSTDITESVLIYYTDYDGTLEDITITPDSWIYSLPYTSFPQAMRSGEYVSISARNLEEFGGITVEIYIDKELFKSDSDYGYDAYARCSGIIP